MRSKSKEQKILQFKILPFINKRFGSVSAFKVLKYMTEFIVARRLGGFTVYEISFSIPPSEIMTRTALISIVMKADGVTLTTAQKAVDKLIEKEILSHDHETDIIELVVDIEDFTDIYLKLQENGVSVTQHREESDVELLTIAIRDQICGVADMIFKDIKNKKTRIVEINGYD